MGDQDDFEKGLGAPGDLESASEGKAAVVETETGVTPAGTRPFRAPEIIRNMSPEERAAAEKRLKWKIDLRLMPMIILSRPSFPFGFVFSGTSAASEHTERG